MALPEKEDACEQTVELLRQINDSEVILSAADGLLFNASDMLSHSSVAVQRLSHAEEALMHHTRLVREQALLLLPLLRAGCRASPTSKAIGARSAAPPRFLDFPLFVRRVRNLRERTRRVGVTFNSLKHVSLLSEESLGRRVITDRALGAVQDLLDGLVEVAETLAETPSPSTTPRATSSMRDGEQRQPWEKEILLKDSLLPAAQSNPQPQMAPPVTSQIFHLTCDAQRNGGKVDEGTVTDVEPREAKLSEANLNEIRSNEMKMSGSRCSPKPVSRDVSSIADDISYTSDGEETPSPSPQLHLDSRVDDRRKSPWALSPEMQSHSLIIANSKPCDRVDSLASIAAAHSVLLSDIRAANPLLRGDAHAPLPPYTPVCVPLQSGEGHATGAPVTTRVTSQRRVFSREKWTVRFCDDKGREEGDNNWRGVFVSEVARLFDIPCDWVTNVMAESDAEPNGSVAVTFDLRLPENVADDEIEHRIHRHTFSSMRSLYAQIPTSLSPSLSPASPPQFQPVIWVSKTALMSPQISTGELEANLCPAASPPTSGGTRLSPKRDLECARAPRHCADDNVKEEEEERAESLALFLDQLNSAESLARDFICSDECHKRDLIGVTAAQSQRMRERQRLRALVFHAGDSSLCDRHGSAERNKGGVEAAAAEEEEEAKGKRGGSRGRGRGEGEKEEAVDEDGKINRSWPNETYETPLRMTKGQSDVCSPCPGTLSSPAPPPPSRCFTLPPSASPLRVSSSDAHVAGSHSPNPSNCCESRGYARNNRGVDPLSLGHNFAGTEKSFVEDKWLTSTHEKVLRGDAWDVVLATAMDELYGIFPAELAELFDLPVENVCDVRFTLGSLHVSFELVHDRYLKEAEINELLLVFDFPRVRALYRRCVESGCGITPPRERDTTNETIVPRDEVHSTPAAPFLSAADGPQSGRSPVGSTTVPPTAQGMGCMYGPSVRGPRDEWDERGRATTLFWSGAATPDNEPVTLSHLALVHDVPLHLLLEANPQLSVFAPSDALPDAASVIIPRAMTDDMRCIASFAPDGSEVRSSRSVTPVIASPTPARQWTPRDGDAALARAAPHMNLKGVARRMNVSLQALRQRNAHLDKYGDTEVLPRNCSINVPALLLTAEPLSGMSSMRSSPRSPLFSQRDIPSKPANMLLAPAPQQQQQQQQGILHQAPQVCVGAQGALRDDSAALSGPPANGCSPAKGLCVNAQESMSTDTAVRYEQAVRVMAHSASKFLQLRYFTLWHFASRLRSRQSAETDTGNTRVAPSLRRIYTSRIDSSGGGRAKKYPHTMTRNHVVTITEENGHTMTKDNVRSLSAQSGRSSSVSGGRSAERSRCLLSFSPAARRPASPRGDLRTTEATATEATAEVIGPTVHEPTARVPRLLRPSSRATSASSLSRDGRSPRIVFPVGLDERIAAERFVLDMRVSPSMFVVEVRGAAASAGVQRGDEIREVNGVRVRYIAQFRAAVEEARGPNVFVAVRNAGGVATYCICHNDKEGESKSEPKSGGAEREGEAGDSAVRAPVIAPPVGAAERQCRRQSAPHTPIPREMLRCLHRAQ